MLTFKSSTNFNTTNHSHNLSFQKHFNNIKKAKADCFSPQKQPATNIKKAFPALENTTTLNIAKGIIES